MSHVIHVIAFEHVRETRDKVLLIAHPWYASNTNLPL